MMWKFHSVSIAIGLLFGAGIAGADDDPVPPRSASGQSLALPAAQQDLGEVFHVIPGVGTHMTWRHDATFVNSLATCSRAVGYFVTPFDLEEGDEPLLAGAVRVPVASLRSTYTQFEQSLHGARFLNQAQFPEIRLLLKGVRDVKRSEPEHKRRIYNLTLLADLYIRDQKIELECPAVVALVPLTWDIIQLTHGDVLIVRTRIELSRAQVGFPPTQPAAAAFTGEKIMLELALFCATMPPDLHLDPRTERAHFVKLQQFLTLVRDFRDAEKAYEFAREYAQEAWDTPRALFELATAIVQEDDLAWRDLALALKVARRANELTGSNDPHFLHILAQTHYQRGELDQALKWARMATEHIEDADRYVRPAIEASLPQIEAAVEREKAE